MSAYPPEWTLSFDTEEAVAAAVKRHEQDIRELQTRHRLLLSRHNSLSITGRLPHELLAEIFIALVEEWFRRYSADAYPRWEWLGILQVCHLWREVAMRTPRLWQYIRIHGQYWDPSSNFPLTMYEISELSLHLSGQVPLTVLRGSLLPTDPLPKDADEALCRLVLRNMHRVRNLSTPLDMFFSPAESHDGYDAPVLDTLTIRARRHDEEDKVDHDMVRRSAWPKLRTLEAHSLPSAVIQAALRPSLTTLVVQNSRPSHTSPATWIELLRMLPLLEQLSLHRVVHASQGSRVASAPEPVVLRSLARLSLKEFGTGAGCSQLLENLIIPVQAVVSYVMYRNATEDDIQSTTKALGWNVRRRIDEPAGTQLANQTTAIKLNLPADDIDPSLRLYSRPDVASVPWDRPGRLKGARPTTTMKLPENHDIPLDALVAHYPLANLRVVRIHCGTQSFLTPGGWALLSQLPRVCDIELSYADTPIVWGLSRRLGLPDAFPALETLVFQLIQGDAGSERRTQHQRARHDRHKDAVFTPLAAALAQRRAGGTPLRSLAVIGAHRLGTRGTDGPYEPWRRLERQVENFKLDVRDVFEYECSSCEES